MKKLVCLHLVCTLLAVSAAALAEPVKLVFWDMIWALQVFMTRRGKRLWRSLTPSQDELKWNIKRFPGTTTTGIFDCHHIRRRPGRGDCRFANADAVRLDG